jgi:phenylpropionate dioxygenase-like ring-hydroxylating dioxygenase large terminal subunit
VASTMTPAKTPAWRAPTRPEDRNYPYNCWWVAAFSSEVGRELLGRWLLDTPVLLYRREDGQAVALDNRCPHRAAPLSMGCLKGDDVQCRYHGFTFGSDGACVRVPSMKSPPQALHIRAFPVIEQRPFVWIYLGEPARIDDVPRPHRLEWADDSKFAINRGRMDTAANYMLLKENVLDLTHFGYVHASTFKITDWVDPPVFSTDGDITTYHQSFKRSPLPPTFAEPLGLATGTPFDRENYGSFVSPAQQIAAVDFIDPDSHAIAGRFRISHATTPIDGTHMHYFWVFGRDHGTRPEQMAEAEALTKKGFAEDEAMIEAVQAMLSRDPRGADAPEISVKTDTAGVQARRIVQRWMERETA